MTTASSLRKNKLEIDFGLRQREKNPLFFQILSVSPSFFFSGRASIDYM